MIAKPAVLIALLLVPVAVQATTLDEAVAAALHHAPEIEAAQADSDAALAQIRTARAAGLPTATLSGSIGYGRLDPGGYFGLPAANVTPRAAQLVLEQPLFTGGRVQAGVAAASAGSAMAEAGARLTHSQILVATVAAYTEVLTSGQAVMLYRQLVGQMAELERQAGLRFRAGESPATDTAQAGARHAEACAAHEQALGALVAATATFTRLTGLSPDDLLPLPPPPATPATPDEALAQAMAGNAALAGAEAALAAARAAARAARAERWPTIGAFAEGSLVRDQFFPDYRADAVTVGARARWLLSAGGRVAATVTAADSAVSAADARLRAGRALIREQVVTAMQAVRTAGRVAEAAVIQAAATATARDSVRHEVRVGLKPQIDLLNAEREATAAAVQVARSNAEQTVAAYRLLALLNR